MNKNNPILPFEKVEIIFLVVEIIFLRKFFGSNKTIPITIIIKKQLKKKTFFIQYRIVSDNKVN